MIKISVDGQLYDVKPGKNLLETCLALGLDIPHFCYHPALGSVGACRLCAVKRFKDPGDRKGRLVMSCLEPVTEGMIVSIYDAEAKAFRSSVIESLMTNHPHDCPVCDEAGECHLQDMTVMTGHNYRRFDFKKRTYKNQELGPFINHEMNRCIQCYRCVRFYRQYAGGKDLNTFASRNHVYFGRFSDGTLENEFSGNLVEVCPTGVFTDKTLRRHFTRKWDLSNAPSVCVHCSVGCNTIISERYDSLRRVMSRYNGAVNGYFLCDRGRFGYEFVNDQNRIRKVTIRSEKNVSPEEVDDDLLFSTLKKSLSKNNRIIGIGSPRASVESNFALYTLVGKENFYHGVSKKEHDLTNTVLDFLQKSGIRTPSLRQIEKTDCVMVLGEDITSTAPMIALAIRQAARNLSFEEALKKSMPLWNDLSVRDLSQDKKIPIFIATPIKDNLDDIAEYSFRGSYAEIAGLGHAVSSILSDNAPVFKFTVKEQQELAEKIALALRKAKNPLIISGINCGDPEIVNSALNIANALLSLDSVVNLSIVLPECNSMGLSLIPGKPLEEAFSLAVNEDIDTLIILENDLYRRTKEESVDKLFNRSRKIIVLDHLRNKTSLHADILLPVSTYAESEGTLVSYEGRAQRFYKALVNKGQVSESWRWISELIKLKDNLQTVPRNLFDDIVKSMVKELTVFSSLSEYMPDADFRMLNTKVPRQTIRYSGRTAINALVSVSETKIPQDPDSPLTFSMEGEPQNPPSSLVPFYWVPGWNSVQAMYFYLDEPNGSLVGGNPGLRLIEPPTKNNYPYFRINSQSIEFKTNEWLIVPVFKIFGSEELSSASHSIQQRINEPFVCLNIKDAEKLNVSENESIQLEVSGIRLSLKLKIENSLQQGIAGLAVNLPGMQFADLPGYGKFHKT